MSKLLSFKKTLEIEIPAIELDEKEEIEVEVVSQFDHVIFSLEEKCPDCDKSLYPEEVISGWRKSYHDYRTKCPMSSCGKCFIAKYELDNI